MKSVVELSAALMAGFCLGFGIAVGSLPLILLSLGFSLAGLLISISR